MEDSLLDGLDESLCFIEVTQGLSLTEVVCSVVCSVAEVYHDREIACEGGRVQLSRPREVVGERRMQAGMVPFEAGKSCRFQCHLGSLKHGIIGAASRRVVQTLGVIQIGCLQGLLSLGDLH
jgi:hypothetical protein